MLSRGENRNPEWAWIFYSSDPNERDLQEAGPDTLEEAERGIRRCVQAYAEEDGTGRSATFIVTPPMQGREALALAKSGPPGAKVVRLAADSDGDVRGDLRVELAARLPIRIEVAIDDETPAPETVTLTAP